MLIAKVYIWQQQWDSLWSLWKWTEYVFVYLCICVFVYLCICVFVNLVLSNIVGGLMAGSSVEANSSNSCRRREDQSAAAQSYQGTFHLTPSTQQLFTNYITELPPRYLPQIIIITKCHHRQSPTSARFSPRTTIGGPPIDIYHSAAAKSYQGIFHQTISAIIIFTNIHQVKKRTVKALFKNMMSMSLKNPWNPPWRWYFKAHVDI